MADDLRAAYAAKIREILELHRKPGDAPGSAPDPTRELKELDADHRRAVTADLRADTDLKKTYAKWFIGILIGQLVVMNAVIGGVGADCLRFEDYALHLYMGGTLAEVFGVVLVITRYLFPKRQ